MDERRDISRPQEGYWLVRLVKKGPLVPAAIIREHTTAEPGNPTNKMERSPTLAAYIAGNPCDIDKVWLRRGAPISEAEYKYQVADGEWARSYAPNDPKAEPNKPIDLLKSRTPF